MRPQEVFKSKSKAVPIIIEKKEIDPEGKEITTQINWTVKPLSARLMVQNYSHFVNLEKIEKSPERDQAKILEGLIPLIDVVLPFCCVDPKLVMEGETNEKQIHIDDLDIEALMNLFTKIFEISGLGKKADDKIENLESPPSLTQ